MLLQNTAIVAKKLLVDEKITACVKQICLQGVVCKVSKIKTLSGERFGFVKKRLLHQHLNVVLRGKIVFFIVVLVYELLIGHNQLSRNELLFSCNPTGQLCVSGPRYRIRTVYAYMKHWRRKCVSWLRDDRLLRKCIFQCHASPAQENQDGGLHLVDFLSPWESCCSSATWLLLVGPIL